MASLIDVDGETGKKLGGWLLFSNPDSTRSRSRITINASNDKGRTWPAHHRLLLDEGRGAGYSCMTMVDKKTVGILYEGSGAHLVFQRIPLGDLTRNRKPATGSKTADAKRKTNDKRPNILRIVGEDHGCELSCYGDPVIKTPHIDRLASQGILFQNGYVTQSVCSPSRSSIFTGLYCFVSAELRN